MGRSNPPHLERIFNVTEIHTFYFHLSHNSESIFYRSSLNTASVFFYHLLENGFYNICWGIYIGS